MESKQRRPVFFRRVRAGESIPVPKCGGTGLLIATLLFALPGCVPVAENEGDDDCASRLCPPDQRCIVRDDGTSECVANDGEDDCRSLAAGCPDGATCRQTPSGLYRCLPDPDAGAGPDCRSAIVPCPAGTECAQTGPMTFECVGRPDGSLAPMDLGLQPLDLGAPVADAGRPFLDGAPADAAPMDAAGDPRCRDLDCGAHGRCEAGECQCLDGYQGDRCDQPPPLCRDGLLSAPARYGDPVGMCDQRGTNASSVGLSDLDRDGRLDLIIGMEQRLYSHAGWALWMNVGGGQFGAPRFVDHYDGAGIPRSIVAADLDGDGVDRIIFSQIMWESRVCAYSTDGRGGFARRGNMCVPHFRVDVQYLTAADLDGDGRDEVILADRTEDQVRIFGMRGEEVLTEFTSLAAGDSPIFVAVADLNGDRVSDIVSANSVDNDLSVFLSVGAGEYADGVRLPMGARPNHLSIKDVNRDGHLDLIVSPGLTLFAGDGRGGFGPAQVLDETNVRFAIVEDFDGDGLLDLATVRRDELALAAGLEEGGFGPLQIRGEAGGRHALVADINADGLPDLLLAGADNCGVVVYLGGGCRAEANP